MGYLQWRWGLQSAMNTSLVRDTKTSHFTLAFQVRKVFLYDSRGSPRLTTYLGVEFQLLSKRPLSELGFSLDFACLI